MHKFNVYDINWGYVDTFYNGGTLGMAEVGDYILSPKGEWYNVRVYIKRMS